MFGAPIPPSERPPPLRSIRQMPSSAPDVPWSHDVFTYRTGPLAGTNMASSRLEGCGGDGGHTGGGEMRIQAAVAVMLAAVLGGCMFTDEDSGPASTPTSDPTAAGREATRSIWGVVPSAPRRKADLKPELIQGAAIAVSADTLLADCRATEGRSSVGLVRHNKYRIAKVTHDGAGQVCLLTVSEGPLSPAAGYRSFADLRVGEPVTALASHTSAEVALVRGAGW